MIINRIKMKAAALKAIVSFMLALKHHHANLNGSSISLYVR